MTLEEYKSQVLKYDGEAKPVTIGDEWPNFSRRTRREIERLVRKGKNPDIMNYI